MKKLLLISCLSSISIMTFAQNFSCVSVAQNKAVLYAKNELAQTNTQKTIRVIIHFPLKSNGVGNFTETKDCNGNVSDYNGYWFAEKFIERSNYCLRNNEKMTQQLSYKPIPIKPINIQFELAGLIFHRDNNLFYYTKKDSNSPEKVANSTTLSRAANAIESSLNESAIHIFLYKGAWGSGIAYLSSNVCVVSGVDVAFNGYMNDIGNNWWFDARIVSAVIHEIGHCLSLVHPKLSADGIQCKSQNCTYDDGCSDTPTYQELIADNYKNPYEWCGEESSNNIMDYSCNQSAWTPQQIEKVHLNIAQRKYLYPNVFKYKTETVTGILSQGNKVVIAKNVTVQNVSVSQNNALYINCDEFQTEGEFEVELGATLNIK